MTGPRKKGPPKKRTKEKSAPAPLRTGLPDHDSIKASVDFVSPGGVRYTILKTSEMDAYDQPPSRKSRTRKKP
jgi:hypothetical protein